MYTEQGIYQVNTLSYKYPAKYYLHAVYCVHICTVHSIIDVHYTLYSRYVLYICMYTYCIYVHNMHCILDIYAHVLLVVLVWLFVE